MIESQVICDSIGEHSPRLVTMLCKYPKFVHGEHLRHRSFSFSVSSSRAIPVSKNLEEVRSDELRAAPVWWGREQKGMQSGEELEDRTETFPYYYRGSHSADYLTPLKTAQRIWNDAAYEASLAAMKLQQIGAHKSIINRLLEPFLHVNVLVTGTEPRWMNFFGLRLDKAAQPEIRVLAEAQWKCWNRSRPQQLKPGQWHLPFIDDRTSDVIRRVVNYDSGDGPEDQLNMAIKISVARCARLSYLSFETKKPSTIEEDLALYERLLGSSPIHASPAEHQATPDIWKNRHFLPANFKDQPYYLNHQNNWKHFEQSGNLGPGWRQYRKMLPNESMAPLPAQYR